MKVTYDTRYPSIDDLRKRAMQKIPRFAFEYLDGGCNEDVNLFRNTAELREVILKPVYLRARQEPDLRTTLFGHTWDAPFGIAPIGLQGLMWPGAPEILARASVTHNIPFILSTVTTASIENIGKITEGRAWFQLYHPADTEVRKSILDRARSAGLDVLVLLCDVPSFGFRPRDIRNGLAMPPRMTLRNVMQILSRPHWALRTLAHGKPEFANLKPYMPGSLNMKRLGEFMNQTFSGYLDEERIKRIREYWKGKIVLKGVASEEDAATAWRLGLDGIIVSNHGGRQLDAGESSIRSLNGIVSAYKDKFPVMLDSGIRSGPDIARAMACHADFTFLGRSFMYGIAALGEKGGDHVATLLKLQLRQILDQLCCANPAQLPEHRIHQ